MTAQQLKNSILQMAVQGKLVPQDPNDEPASVLLERIRKEKEELVKQGKIKKEKNPSYIFRGPDNIPYEKRGDKEPVCIADEVPFEIPESWEWCRFGTALVNRDAERIPLSVADRSKLQKKYDYYGASGVIDKVDKFLFDKPLLLIGEDGANLLSRSTPIAFIASGYYWVNNHAHVLDCVGGLLLEYIAIFINSISLAPYVTGTAQPKMNQEKMNSILVAIPPVNEQRRIIEKISDILEESSQSWNEMFAEFRNEFTELFEEYDEMVDEYGDLAEDDPELMQEEIAMQNVRLFAGMLINAGTSIGNFLNASAKLVSGELPGVHLHNESEKQVEDTYKAGEHLSIERGVYTHHGIYVGGGKVIHYSQGYDSVPEIREVSFKEFAGISKVSIVPEKDSPLRFTADEAVKRAYSRLGERSYNLVYNNCENFVRWCRAGC